jgi:hypothetical protein
MLYTRTLRQTIRYWPASRLASRRSIGIGIVFVAQVFGAGNARAAEPDTNTVKLLWHRETGAESCATQSKLEELVRRRLGRDPFATDAPRALDASVSSDSGNWHVELRVRDASGNSLGQRIFDVRADSCDQVVDAVGLAVALAIDPNASLKIDAKAPEIEPPHNAGMADGAPGDQKDPPDSTDKPKVLPSPYPYAQLLAPVAAACPAPNTWGTRVALRGVAAAGLLPGVAPGIEFAASVAHHHSHPFLGISYFAEAALDPRFAFGLTTINAGYCHDFVTTHRVSAGLCAAAHVGAQHVVVSQLQPLNPGDHVFVAASLGPTFNWLLLGPLYLEVGVSAWVPIPGAHPSFYISGQNSPVFESNALSGVAFLGVGLMTN